jgi:hypothetical protein
MALVRSEWPVGIIDVEETRSLIGPHVIYLRRAGVSGPGPTGSIILP